MEFRKNDNTIKRTKMKKLIYIITVLLLLSSCSKKEVKIIELPFKFGINNAEPSLVTHKGKLSLSWINSIRGEEATLFYTEFENEKWKAPTKLSSGNDWFVNWADFPANATNGDVLLTSHLQKSATGTYTYDVCVKSSKAKRANHKRKFFIEY